MTEFDGGISSMSQRVVSGWAHATIDGLPQALSITLHFRTLGAFSPSDVVTHPDGWVNFIFELPERFQLMGWDAFLDEFLTVAAWCPASPEAQAWPVPLRKSALLPPNRTALEARLRDYSLTPAQNGRIAVFTIVYNEHSMLPIWLKYYVPQFGAENVYILDHGSDRPYSDVPDGVTVIRFPRDEFDNWQICRVVAFYQRFLLEAYDSVLYTDSDEFVCASPEALDGRTLAQLLLQVPGPIGITKGYNLRHDVHREPVYDPTRPVLSQRRYITRAREMDKPLISRVPLSWIPGFHKAREGGVQVPGLFLLHLRYFDLNHAMVKGGVYRCSKWNPYDLEHGLGGHQLQDESGILSEFEMLARSFSELTDASFDADADTSVIPDWMHAAIDI